MLIKLLASTFDNTSVKKSQIYFDNDVRANLPSNLIRRYETVVFAFTFTFATVSLILEMQINFTEYITSSDGLRDCFPE